MQITYYNDNPKLFSSLIILIEDYPYIYLHKLKTEIKYLDIAEWIKGMFIISKTTTIELTLENEIQFILNNITELPFCKCKVKLRMLN